MTAKAVAIVFVSAVLGGCAMDAPPLPPDTTGSTSAHHVSAADFTPQDRELSCVQIGEQRGALHEGIDKANANIAGNRTGNQVAGYFGALFVLPLVATQGNYSDKDVIKAAYVRLDTLNQLAVYKACSG